MDLYRLKMHFYEHCSSNVYSILQMSKLRQGKGRKGVSTWSNSPCTNLRQVAGDTLMESPSWVRVWWQPTSQHSSGVRAANTWFCLFPLHIFCLVPGPRLRIEFKFQSSSVFKHLKLNPAFLCSVMLFFYFFRSTYVSKPCAFIIVELYTQRIEFQ